MVICPIAIAVGCKRCPAFSVCPVKSAIGDYKPGDKPVEAAPASAPASAPGAAAKPRPRTAAAKTKVGSNRKGARARRPRK